MAVSQIVQIQGYFTVERNIKGLDSHELESALGFRPGRLAQGATIFRLVREPLLSEFTQGGSTLYPGTSGLDPNVLSATKFLPGAWIGQNLVKVRPTIPHSDSETYPPALDRRVEQWILIKPVGAIEVCQLKPGQRYWG